MGSTESTPGFVGFDPIRVTAHMRADASSQAPRTSVAHAALAGTSESVWRPCIAVLLNEGVEHHAILIHGTSNVMPQATGSHEPVAGSRPAATQTVGKALREFPAPVGRIGQPLLASTEKPGRQTGVR